MSITLPPLPEPEHEEFTDDCTFWSPEGWSREQLRARDLEVARVVLEGAAKECDEQRNRSKTSYDKAKRDRDLQIYHHSATTAKWCADAIRALEVRHHE